MPLPAPYRLVTVSEDRAEDVLRLDTWAFASGIPLATHVTLPIGIPWDRAYGVERDGGTPGELAGFHAAYPLRAYPVPGAEVACGWLTWVGVHPGHRRRGILRAMMEHHFADLAANGEAISGLMAAETAIYGRFGYGMAAPQVSLSIPRGAALRDVAGSDDLEVSLQEWDAATHGDVCAGIHRRYAQLPEGIGRPGWATRETPALREWFDSDPKELRRGKESQRVVLVQDASGTPLAYATFRRTLEWTRGGSEGKVSVDEAVALTPAAAHRLWSVLLDLDLTSTVRVETLPVDDPIVSLLVDLRGAEPDYQDNTWIRLVDLPTALAQRRYAGDVDVVLEVTDAMIPANAGTWRVRASAWGHATVERTDAAADLAMDIRELSAAHLGSLSLTALAQSGLIEVRAPRALAPVAAAWRWPVAAAANWIF